MAFLSGLHAAAVVGELREAGGGERLDRAELQAGARLGSPRRAQR